MMALRGQSADAEDILFSCPHCGGPCKERDTTNKIYICYRCNIYYRYSRHLLPRSSHNKGEGTSGSEETNEYKKEE